MVRDDAAYPFHGSAVAGGNGKVAVGILIHALVTVGKDLSITTVVDSLSFSGLTKEDTNGDGAPDTEDFWAGSDCSSVEL